VIWIVALAALAAFIFFLRHGLHAGVRTREPRRAAPPALSARWLLAECPRLAGIGATWVEIGAAVNPAHDAEVDALLARLRAAHDGAVAEALQAIEAGCRDALAQNGEASAFDALTEAVRSSPWTSEARW
jgi:hypothetical protein